uniref:Uncharacterized protein n=1 Tax=Knipowitschia caucasica TaxID=637954 RepID=A0AAV2KYM7_KNICA
MSHLQMAVFNTLYQRQFSRRREATSAPGSQSSVLFCFSHGCFTAFLHNEPEHNQLTTVPSCEGRSAHHVPGGSTCETLAQPNTTTACIECSNGSASQNTSESGQRNVNSAQLDQQLRLDSLNNGSQDVLLNKTIDNGKQNLTQKINNTSSSSSSPFNISTQEPAKSSDLSAEPEASTGFTNSPTVQYLSSLVEVAGQDLTSHLVDTASLLAILLFGLLFFFVIVTLFVTQAYESYRRKDYTQVDYLINGMYSDSGV